MVKVGGQPHHGKQRDHGLSMNQSYQHISHTCLNPVTSESVNWLFVTAKFCAFRKKPEFCGAIAMMLIEGSRQYIF